MAVTFTGTTYLSTTSIPGGGLNINTAPHTFACWVYCTNRAGSIIGGSTDTSCFVGIVGSTTSGAGFQDAAWIGAYEPNDLVNWDMEASNFAQEVFTLPGLTMPLNTWTHIAGTFDGTNSVIYVNGVSQGTASGGGVATTVAWNRLVIGGFNGDAQDAWIFSRALNSTEVGQIMNGGRTVSTTGLVGHWPLIAGATKLNDVSGNGRTLTATGSVPDSGNNGPVAWNEITGTGQSSVSGAATRSQAVAFTGTGQASVSGSATRSQGVAFVGTGQSSVSGAAAVSEAVAVAGTGQSSVSGTATVSVAGVSDLIGTGQSGVSGSAAASSSVSVTGTGQSSVTGAASASQAAALVGTGQAAVSATGTLTGVAPPALGNKNNYPASRRFQAILSVRRNIRG